MNSYYFIFTLFLYIAFSNANNIYEEYKNNNNMIYSNLTSVKKELDDGYMYINKRYTSINNEINNNIVSNLNVILNKINNNYYYRSNQFHKISPENYDKLVTIKNSITRSINSNVNIQNNALYQEMNDFGYLISNLITQFVNNNVLYDDLQILYGYVQSSIFNNYVNNVMYRTSNNLETLLNMINNADKQHNIICDPFSQCPDLQLNYNKLVKEYEEIKLQNLIIFVIFMVVSFSIVSVIIAWAIMLCKKNCYKCNY